MGSTPSELNLGEGQNTIRTDSMYVGHRKGSANLTLGADGALDLREINYAFNVSLPQLEHRSLNGFIIEELGHVPERGETLEREGVRIDVVDATETQVLRARVRKIVAREKKKAD